MRPLLANVLARLVAGDAEGLKRDRIDPHPASDPYLWVREYESRGGRLVMPPVTIWEHSWTDVVPLDDGSGVAIDLPLWTENESPSDLMLSVIVRTVGPDPQVEIVDLRVP